MNHGRRVLKSKKGKQHHDKAKKDKTTNNDYIV